MPLTFIINNTIWVRKKPYVANNIDMGTQSILLLKKNDNAISLIFGFEAFLVVRTTPATITKTVPNQSSISIVSFSPRILFSLLSLVFLS